MFIQDKNLTSGHRKSSEVGSVIVNPSLSLGLVVPLEIGVEIGCILLFKRAIPAASAKSSGGVYFGLLIGVSRVSIEGSSPLFFWFRIDDAVSDERVPPSRVGDDPFPTLRDGRFLSL